jgi:hypothetical protein
LLVGVEEEEVMEDPLAAAAAVREDLEQVQLPYPPVHIQSL